LFLFLSCVRVAGDDDQLRICYVCHCSDAEVRFYKGVRGVCAEHWSAEMRMRRKDIAYRRPPRKFNEGFMFKTPKALGYQLTKVVTDGGMTGEQVAEGTAMMFAAVAKTTDNPMQMLKIFNDIFKDLIRHG
jgi:hypothetical protein